MDDFIKETEEDPVPRYSTELTGWETVIFEVAEAEEPEE